ncbi:MAG: hypothetical protein ACTS3F_06930 [Phycisphaerales bacterium]
MRGDGRGERVAGAGGGGGGGGGAPAARSWLGIHFNCCHVYGRLYKSRDGTRYSGMCPRCGAALHCMVGAGGTQRRFFETR